MSFQSKYRVFGRSYSPSTHCDIIVQPNLAITPSRMAELVDQGIPVSSSIISGMAFDGVNNPSWDLPIDQKRGVDVAEVWQAQRSARKIITSKVVVKNES